MATAGGSIPSPILGLQAAYLAKSMPWPATWPLRSKPRLKAVQQLPLFSAPSPTPESIHARNHHEALRALGGELNPDGKKPMPRSTREKPCRRQVRRRARTLLLDYPSLITEASAARESRSLRSFVLAAMAEANHAPPFSAALRALEMGEEITEHYFVCSICGNVSTAKPRRRCTICQEFAKRKAAGEEGLIFVA